MPWKSPKSRVCAAEAVGGTACGGGWGAFWKAEKPPKSEQME